MRVDTAPEDIPDRLLATPRSGRLAEGTPWPQPVAAPVPRLESLRFGPQILLPQSIMAFIGPLEKKKQANTSIPSYAVLA